jgi:NADH-quinone oxidoreductase subunit L
MNLILLLIVLFPLAGFLFIGLFRNQMTKTLTSITACGTVFISFALSLMAFVRVKNGGAAVVKYFDFINVGNLKIPFAFQIDQLSALFLLIITGVGFLIHVFSTSYMHEESNNYFGRYFSYLNLFIFSMLLLVLGENFLILFIGWEGVSLCSYLLIGFWFKNTEYNKAASKAFLMNRIGDFAFLLALFILAGKLNTLSFTEIFTPATLAKLSSGNILAITLLLFAGATSKSAQIPLYTWLPDAMAGPTPVSALIHAATMVTAGLYLVARCNLMYSMAPITMNFVVVIGMATALLAASIALKQNDIKKVLAYSTVSQLGFMFLALGSGAYVAAVFHVMTHAFFKALLFLGSGSVIHAMNGEQDMRKMGGLGKHMKITGITFLIGCLAISGFPLLSGFFSKDEILVAAWTKSPALWATGIFTALLTAIYMFRLYATTFRGNFRGTKEQEQHLHESPAAITIPLIALAILSIIGGFVGVPQFMIHNVHVLNDFLHPVFAESYSRLAAHDISHNTEWLLMIAATVMALIGMVYGWMKFTKKPNLKNATGFGKILEHKWYVDELYNTIFVKPYKVFGTFLYNIVDIKIVDGIVNGTGRLVKYGGRQFRRIQSGQIASYILMMVLGMLFIFIIQFFLRK